DQLLSKNDLTRSAETFPWLEPWHHLTPRGRTSVWLVNKWLRVRVPRPLHARLVRPSDDWCPTTVRVVSRRRCHRPLELELDLLLALVAFVLDGELRPLRNPEPLAGDLDAERLVLLQG